MVFVGNYFYLLDCFGEMFGFFRLFSGVGLHVNTIYCIFCFVHGGMDMQNQSDRIKIMMATGIEQKAAETIVDLANAYRVDRRGFDEGYWLSRLHRAGCSETIANDIIDMLYHGVEALPRVLGKV